MNKLIVLIGVVLFTSCEDKEKGSIDDLVVAKEDGGQEVKVEQLSIEDVARLEAEAGKQGEIYQGVLNNEIEKTYNLKSDTNQRITWKLDASQSNASIFLYKEVISTVKKDSLNLLKVKDYKLVCQSDSCVQNNKKQTNYKVVVKLDPKFSTSDSTCEYTLKIIRN